MTGLHEPYHAQKYDGFIVFGQLSAFGENQNGEDLCRHLIGVNIRRPAFYVSISKEEKAEVMDRDIHRKEEKDAKTPEEMRLFRGYLNSSDTGYLNELLNVLNDNVWTRLNIGFISAGRLTTGIIRTLYSKYQPYFAKLGVVSIAHTEGHNEGGLRAACEISREDPRFKVYETSGSNLENIMDMLQDEYDLILHTSSKSKGAKIREGRNYLWEIDRNVVKDVCTQVIEAERRLAEKGKEVFPLHIVGTNPVGINMMLGIALGMQKERLTGFSYVDPTRAIQWIRDMYFGKTGIFLDEKAIEAKVVGQHGAEILIKSTVRINGKKLEEISLEIDEEEARRGIRGISKEIAEARERVRKEEKYELLHTQVAEAFCNLCVDIAKRRQPSVSLYTIRRLEGLLAGEGYCAYNGPAAFDYEGFEGKGIRIVEQPLGINLPYVTEKEMEIIREEIAAEANFQKEAIETFMQKSNGFWKNLFKKQPK